MSVTSQSPAPPVRPAESPRKTWAERWNKSHRTGARTIRHLAEATGLLAVVAIFACLPVDWASGLGGRIARAVGPHLGVSRRALRNLEQGMPENTEPENRRIVGAMWDNLGRAVAEYPHLARIIGPGSGRVEIVNADALAGYASGGGSCIFFGGHFANWEVGPSALHLLMGDSLLSVYRAPNNPWVDRLARHFHGRRLAVPKGAGGGRALVRHMSGGGNVAMLVDQKQNDGIPVPFFGRDAMTAPAIARLGARFKSPLVPIRIERLNGARFRLTILPPVETDGTGDAARDVLATMTRVNAILEGWIRACPEQWLWLHSRWPK